MSKYTEAIEVLKRNKPTSDPRECGRELCNAVDVAIKALQIADKLEQADAISNEEIQIKACGRYGCLEKECPIRARDKFCYDLAGIFFDGYNQALADVRGDAE